MKKKTRESPAKRQNSEYWNILRAVTEDPFSV